MGARFLSSIITSFEILSSGKFISPGQNNLEHNSLFFSIIYQSSDLWIERSEYLKGRVGHSCTLQYWKEYIFFYHLDIKFRWYGIEWYFSDFLQVFKKVVSPVGINGFITPLWRPKKQRKILRNSTSGVTLEPKSFDYQFLATTGYSERWG